EGQQHYGQQKNQGDRMDSDDRNEEETCDRNSNHHRGCERVLGGDQCRRPESSVAESDWRFLTHAHAFHKLYSAFKMQRREPRDSRRRHLTTAFLPDSHPYHATVIRPSDFGFPSALGFRPSDFFSRRRSRGKTHTDAAAGARRRAPCAWSQSTFPESRS